MRLQVVPANVEAIYVEESPSFQLNLTTRKTNKLSNMNFDLRPQPLAISIGPSSFRVDETMKRNSGNVEVENESCNLHRTTVAYPNFNTQSPLANISSCSEVVCNGLVYNMPQNPTSSTMTSTRSMNNEALDNFTTGHRICVDASMTNRTFSEDDCAMISNTLNIDGISLGGKATYNRSHIPSTTRLSHITSGNSSAMIIKKESQIPECFQISPNIKNSLPRAEPYKAHCTNMTIRDSDLSSHPNQLPQNFTIRPSSRSNNEIFSLRSTSPLNPLPCVRPNSINNFSSDSINENFLQDLETTSNSFPSSCQSSLPAYNPLDKLSSSVHTYHRSNEALDTPIYVSQTSPDPLSYTDKQSKGKRKKISKRKANIEIKDDHNKVRRSRNTSNTFHGRRLDEDLNNLACADEFTSNLSTHSTTTVSLQDDDDDDSWKICGVCNDKATGYHFNAMTCEGCKGFFRRSIKNQKNFVCLNNNQCTIDKEQRKHCQACRLRLCFEIGMKKECIMTEKEIEEKRQLVMANRQKRAAQSWKPSVFSAEQQEILKKLTLSFIDANVLPDGKIIRNGSIVRVDAQLALVSFTGYDEKLYQLITNGMNVEMQSKQNPSCKADVKESHVQHFTDIMDFSIKQILKFCKEMETLFEDLFLEDKVALLKGGCSELMFIKANYTYDKKRDVLTLGPEIAYTRESFVKGGMSPMYADRYLRFHKDLAELEPDDTEMTCLCILSLFSADRCPLRQKSLIHERQEEISVMLQAYIETKMNKQTTRCAKLMNFLVRLRNLNQLCADSFKDIETNFGNEISPLVKEVQPPRSPSKDKI